MNWPIQRPELIPPRRGWILYDGQCGFCSRWVHFWEKTVEPRGFALKDLQSAHAEGMLEMPPENLLEDILILTRQNKFERGADAYLFVARQIWWAWPFYALFSLPGFHWILWQGYGWFNRNRYLVSRHCPLPRPPAPRRSPKRSA
jgi:predicted DCC family thiol-disulfide oxidoreductase YuxK